MLECICGRYHVALWLGHLHKRRHYWLVSFFCVWLLSLICGISVLSGQGLPVCPPSLQKVTRSKIVWRGGSKLCVNLPAHPSTRLQSCKTPNPRVSSSEFLQKHRSQDTPRRLGNLKRVCNNLLQADKSIMLLCPFINWRVCIHPPDAVCQQIKKSQIINIFSLVTVKSNVRC